jgi:hypothetical protein
MGEVGLGRVRYLGEGRAFIVGAETDYRYEFLPGKKFDWVDRRDVAGFGELTLNDKPLFEVLT